MIADIDHFKWFNDEYGHAAGDDILQRVCQVLAATSGPGSLVAPIGGEELATFVPGSAEPVAKAFQTAVADLQPRVTASIGVIDVSHADCSEPRALWRVLDAAGHPGSDRHRGLTERVRLSRPALPPGC